MRIFFAVDLPLEIKIRIADFLKTLEGTLLYQSVRWYHADQLHITLQFLPHIEKQELDPLIDRVANALVIPVFELGFAQLELFPEPSHPHILSLAPKESTALNELAKIIATELTALNYSVEQRAFRAHITLGRFINTDVSFISNKPLPTFLLPNIQIQEIVLYQSKREDNHSHYHPLAYFPLNRPRL